MRYFSFVLPLVLLVACSESSYFPDGQGAGDSAVAAPEANVPSDIGPREPAGYYAGEPVVYAHTADSLYKVDPDTLKVTLIGTFTGAAASDKMTDIALDRQGNMIGISTTTVYSINTGTAACTRLADLQTLGQGFTGLSFIYSDVPDGKEALWAAALDGTVVEVDPATGTSKKVGSYGGPVSSGDIVSIKALSSTLATVKKDQVTANDWLAKLNTLTGEATLIGDTGFQNVWGVGFWKSKNQNKIFGFTEKGEFILIDPATGKGTLVSAGGPAWWGAGVTTAAPAIN
jgi:hypothetical protein